MPEVYLAFFFPVQQAIDSVAKSLPAALMINNIKKEYCLASKIIEV